MSAAPREIKRDGTSGLKITWHDGSTRSFSSEVLRRNCPCASCKEQRGDTSHAKPLTGRKRSLTVLKSSLDQEIELQQIWGVGNYAIGIKWGDGHDSGIYTFDYLQQLS
jgi:DUF971 family protein